MRTFATKAAAAAVGLGLVVGAAYAASAEQISPEARAYLGFSFGGQQLAARDFHYGLRVDHDSRFVDAAQPPMIRLDFNRRGLNDLQVNGLSAVRQSYRLRQSEEEVIADEFSDEPGFFEGIGNWFGGLFGGGDDAEETAEAAEEELPAEEYPTEGAFLGYNAVDWGLVAVGAVGLGLAATAVVDADDTSASGSTGGSTNGGGNPPAACVVVVPVPLPPGCTPPGFASRQHAGTGLVRDPEWQQWLDGGTGQMGDLGGAD